MSSSRSNDPGHANSMRGVDEPSRLGHVVKEGLRVRIMGMHMTRVHSDAGRPISVCILGLVFAPKASRTSHEPPESRHLPGTNEGLACVVREHEDGMRRPSRQPRPAWDSQNVSPCPIPNPCG